MSKVPAMSPPARTDASGLTSVQGSRTDAAATPGVMAGGAGTNAPPRDQPASRLIDSLACDDRHPSRPWVVELRSGALAVALGARAHRLPAPSPEGLGDSSVQRLGGRARGGSRRKSPAVGACGAQSGLRAGCAL